MGNLGGRNDFAASLFWELRGFGLSHVAAYRRRTADKNTADIDFKRVQAQVANDVVGKRPVVHTLDAIGELTPSRFGQLA